MRVFFLLPLLASFALVSAACGSSGDDDDSGDDDEGGSASSSTPRPTRTTRATPTAQAPTFAEGNWTGGEAEASSTGAVAVSMKGTLKSNSASDKQNTRLIYTDGLKTINISISTQYQPFAASVNDGNARVASGNSDEPCTVTYKQADEKRIEGSFTCEDAEVDPGEGVVVITGTFFATR